MPIIKMTGITKNFFLGEMNELCILKGVSLDVAKGEFVSIVGPSGSGKSTLMNLIGTLDKPTSGHYALSGMEVAGLSDNELSDIRNRRIGFVFQTFNLIPRSTALANVELPMLYAGIAANKRKERAEELLDMVGMGGRMGHRPMQLSGGERQRVAIARAMAMNPDILLADEPTGSLDSATGRMVMDIFHDLHQKHGKTIVLITHNEHLANETGRTITLHDGSIVCT